MSDETNDRRGTIENLIFMDEMGWDHLVEALQTVEGPNYGLAMCPAAGSTPFMDGPSFEHDIALLLIDALRDKTKVLLQDYFRPANFGWLPIATVPWVRTAHVHYGNGVPPFMREDTACTRHLDKNVVIYKSEVHQTEPDTKIIHEELRDWFGEDMPREAYDIVFLGDPNRTLDEVRVELRTLGMKHKAERDAANNDIVVLLRREASATEELHPGEQRDRGDASRRRRD
jgi:hypothetical protein